MVRFGFRRDALGQFIELPSLIRGFSKPDHAPHRLYAHCADGSIWRVRRAWPIWFWAYRVAK